ncbi:MAG: HEAT repeat domain-containing protein, partial [Candidatus Methylumidiphilus sp.]
VTNMETSVFKKHSSRFISGGFLLAITSAAIFSDFADARPVDGNLQKQSTATASTDNQISAAITKLSDADLNVRETAKNALIKIGGPAVPALLEVLGIGKKLTKPKFSDKVMEQYIEFEKEHPLPSYARYTPDNAIALAIEALAKIKDERAVGGLLKSLNSYDLFTITLAANALGDMNEVRAVPILLDVLERSADDEIGVRLAAVCALGKIKDPQAVPGLLKMLKVNTYRYRNVGRTRRVTGWGWGLGFGLSGSDDIEMPVLPDKVLDNYEVKAEVVQALGEIKSNLAVPGLLELLMVDNGFFQEKVVIALGKIGDAQAVRGLLEARKMGNNYVKELIPTALGSITTPVLSEALKDNSDVDARILLARTLVKIDHQSLQGWLEIFKNPQSSEVEKKSAVENLIKMGKPAVHGFLEALKSNDAAVRKAAAEALGAIGDTQAAAGLFEAVKDPDPGVQRAAAKSLTQMPFLAKREIRNWLNTLLISLTHKTQ